MIGKGPRKRTNPALLAGPVGVGRSSTDDRAGGARGGRVATIVTVLAAVICVVFYHLAVGGQVLQQSRVWSFTPSIQQQAKSIDAVNMNSSPKLEGKSADDAQAREDVSQKPDVGSSTSTSPSSPEKVVVQPQEKEAVARIQEKKVAILPKEEKSESTSSQAVSPAVANVVEPKSNGASPEPSKEQGKEDSRPFHVRLAESYNAGMDADDFHLNDDEDGVLLITFATKSATEFLENWFLHVKSAGISPYIVGALDEDIFDLCSNRDVPVVLVNGSEILRNRQANYFNTFSKDFKKYSGVKTAFIKSLLDRNISPIVSDADVIWMKDPKEFFKRGSLAKADILISNDCIDVPADEKDNGGCAHVNFNTGVIHIRATEASKNFAEIWNKKIITSDIEWMRDQPSFNLIVREDVNLHNTWSNPIYTNPRRVFNAGGNITLASLPVWLFANGHTYFVQEAKKYNKDETPYSVHMTYQHGDTFGYAYGKRQRLRENGLFLVDNDAYYASGNFLKISNDGAAYPVKPIPEKVHGREPYAVHNDEDHFRRKTIRNALAIAIATKRILILPIMWCYCDKIWNNLNSCRAPGAETMHLPFECPMDHIFDLQPWFLDNDIDFREPHFLENKRMPKSVLDSQAYVRVESNEAPNGSGDSKRESVHTLKPGMAVEDIAKELEKFNDVRILELSSAIDLVKGYRDQETLNKMNSKFNGVLSKKGFFCFTEDWVAMGKPRSIPWEYDVVKRYCGEPEGELDKEGKIHPGEIMNYTDCGCEWGHRTPKKLLLI